jgi:predicted TIM-barrel fold metal-dependent hydrolase
MKPRNGKGEDFMKRLVERTEGRLIYSSGCPAEDARHLAELVREDAMTPEGVAVWLDYIAEMVDEERIRVLDGHSPNNLVN